MVDQPEKPSVDSGGNLPPQKPAAVGKSGSGKIDRTTEKAQEEAAKDRAREGGYQ